MSISHGEFKRRYTAIREYMTNEGLDCLLVFGQADDFKRGNIRYLTGWGKGGCCIFPLEGNPVFLLPPIQATSPKLPKLMAAMDLLELKPSPNPEDQVLAELSRFDNGRRIGVVGTACMSLEMHWVVTGACGSRIVNATDIFESLRIVKSAEEIEKMRISASIADAVYTRLREMIRPGLSEYQIYGEVKKINYEMGCEYSFDLIDAAGSSMNMSFYPTEDTLEANGTLFMEITPAFDGYYAQLPVTLPVGSYSPDLHRMVITWDKADQAARKILRPGLKVSDLYHTLINTVRENGFNSPYRPGHAIGLDALDFWSIDPSNKRILKPGMTLAIHPSVLLEMGDDGCGMGYTYLITETGAERLSRIDLAKELIGSKA